MKRCFMFLIAVVCVIVSLSGCGKVNPPINQTDATTNTTSPTDKQPVLDVNQEIWDRTFNKDGLTVLLNNYTVTNLLDEGYWETAVTLSRVSRLSITDAGELRAGGILADGDIGVIQFTFNKDTGWEQGVYDEVDTVKQYVEEITQDMIETLQVLSGKFESAVWDEQQSAYIIDVEIPYSGPSMEDPSLETPTMLKFEVFFVDGYLSKVNIIEGTSKSVVHSFGTTPIPQLPEI